MFVVGIHGFSREIVCISLGTCNLFNGHQCVKSTVSILNFYQISGNSFVSAQKIARVSYFSWFIQRFLLLVASRRLRWSQSLNIKLSLNLILVLASQHQQSTCVCILYADFIVIIIGVIVVEKHVMFSFIRYLKVRCYFCWLLLAILWTPIAKKCVLNNICIHEEKRILRIKHIRMKLREIKSETKNVESDVKE